MSRIVTLSQFDGGMTNDPRDPAGNVARISKHVDNDTRPHLLTPHPDNNFDPATDPNSASDFDTFRIQLFRFAAGAFYGLGVQGANTKPKIFTKASVGAAWAAGSTTGDFTALGNLGSGPTIFTLYQNYFYGIDDTGWWKYGDLSAPTWTRGINNVLPVNAVPPVVHSKDDIMYFALGSGGNIIGTLNSTTWNNSALVLPTKHNIASLCEDDNYLAIGANTPQDGSIIYLWDRDTSLTTLSEKIDWGSGALKWTGKVGGVLVGCSILEPSGLAINPTVVFRYYDGQKPVEFQRFTTTSAVIYPFFQPFNNLGYFLAEMTINGIDLRGVWKIVRASTGALSVSFDRLPRLDDTITSGKLYGFLRAGDYFHIACANAQDSDKYIVTKTLSTYNTTAIRRTTINPGMDPADKALRKKLYSVSAEYDPLTAGQGFILKYRVDGGSWIAIFTEGTVGRTRTTRTAIVTGARLLDGQEYEFSLEPSGGANVTGFKYEYQTLNVGI